MRLAAWLGALAATSSCADSEGPRLVSVDPTAAARGATVTLVGERLCGADGDCEAAGGVIRIGDDVDAVRANVLDLGATAATIVIPTIAPVGPTAIIATVNEHASNALPFEVLP